MSPEKPEMANRTKKAVGLSGRVRFMGWVASGRGEEAIINGMRGKDFIVAVSPFQAGRPVLQDRGLAADLAMGSLISNSKK